MPPCQTRPMAQTELHFAITDTLKIAYEAHGDQGGPALILLHGFPYSPRAFDEVAPAMALRGARVIVPYLRGYGPTRFLRDTTLRSGEQAALGADVLALMNTLAIPRATLCGYDWGGRAACITAALYPERVNGLVTGNGYNIQNIAASVVPAAPAQEHRLWYQYYFHSERGRAALTNERKDLTDYLWRLWSPNWRFDDATLSASLAAFDNSDFVDVVVQSYKHRFGYAAGDPAYANIEANLAPQPPITVPTISICGGADGVAPLLANDPADVKFTGPFERRILPLVGHNYPQEAPTETIRAITDLMEAALPPNPAT